MSKVLVYEGKHSTEIFDISTKKKQDAAYAHLFKMLDEDFNAYDEDSMNAGHKTIYAKAILGDAVSIRNLMLARYDYEYERVYEEEPVDATKL